MLASKRSVLCGLLAIVASPPAKAAPLAVEVVTNPRLVGYEEVLVFQGIARTDEVWQVVGGCDERPTTKVVFRTGVVGMMKTVRIVGEGFYPRVDRTICITNVEQLDESMRDLLKLSR